VFTEEAVLDPTRPEVTVHCKNCGYTTIMTSTLWPEKESEDNGGERMTAIVRICPKRDTGYYTNDLCVTVTHTETQSLDRTYTVRNGDLCLKKGMLVLKTASETVYIFPTEILDYAGVLE
jgi:hypothetical protein